MRKVMTVVLMAVFLSQGMPLFAQERGASEQAYEHSNDRAIFNRISDWFSTVGKSDVEKRRILNERRAKRHHEYLRRHPEAAKAIKRKMHERGVNPERVKNKLHYARTDAERKAHQAQNSVKQREQQIRANAQGEAKKLETRAISQRNAQPAANIKGSR